eukprot:1339803-Pyramimonas_sp.AAC.1
MANTGYRMSPACPWCPAGPPDALGHEMYDCPRLYDEAQAEDLRWVPKFDCIQKRPQSMGVTGLGNSDWGKFECCVGMPLPPPAISK